MDTVPVTVRLPVPASVTGPRSGAPVHGYVWVDRIVEVASYGSEARCVVGQPGVGDLDGRTIRGACAGGGHWRSGADMGIVERGGVVRPFSLVVPHLRPGPGEPSHLVDVGVGGRVTAADGRCHDVREAARAALVGRRTAQRTLRRRHGTTDSVVPGDPLDTVDPFDLKPDRDAVPLDPYFEDVVLEAVRRDVALVDGVPMVRSAPPETVVVVTTPIAGGRAIKTCIAYAETFVVDTCDVALVLPPTMADRILDEVEDAMRVGPLSGLPLVTPVSEGRFEGSVVTPAPWRGAVPASYGNGGTPLRYRDGRVVDAPVQSPPPPYLGRSIAVSPVVVFRDQRCVSARETEWRRGVGAVLAFGRDLEARYDLRPTGPDAPPELDALDGPSFAP